MTDPEIDRSGEYMWVGDFNNLNASNLIFALTLKTWGDLAACSGQDISGRIFGEAGAAEFATVKNALHLHGLKFADES